MSTQTMVLRMTANMLENSGKPIAANQMRDAVNTIEQLQKGKAQWQPIETAPKDGFHLQLYRPEIQFVGYFAKAGWCSTSCQVIDPPPTHWKPLPEPPNH